MFLADRHGETIDTLRIDPSGRRLGWTPLKDISPAVTEAVIHAEDRRFKTHHGVDFQAFGSVLIRYMLRKPPRGASTITMQLAASIVPQLKPEGTKRTRAQKWRQVRLALKLEKSWHKDEILEAYLNLVYFRGELQGIGAAAQGLFDKDPSGLTRPESAILAALIGSPNASAGSISKRACALAKSSIQALPCPQLQALAEDSLGVRYRIRQHVHIAPHVARMLLKADGAVTTTGTKVVSTIDAPLQRFVIDALNQHLSLLRDRNVFDGAAIVLDNATGEVLAYVGNEGEKSSAPFVDGIVAKRQAGSALKPFLYGLAIEKKLLTATSILDDTPFQISTPTGLYVPGNYDNAFRGPVSLRTALSSSINVPAVRTLVLVGVDAFLERLRELGFTTLTEDADYYGYSLALGSADVTLFELTNAYRVLANGGYRSQPRFRLEEQKNPISKNPVKVIDGNAAFIISTILSDREARSTTFGLENSLSTRFWSAVKTGTSKDMRDNWCVGYTSRYTVGVWVGNFSGQPMRDVSGVSGAAPVWVEVMNYLHRHVSSAAPKSPAGVVSREISFSAKIDTPKKEWFIKGTEPLPNSEIKTLVTHETPKITYPPQDAIIALDPDIPEGHQFVPFEHSGDEGKFVWVLNGQNLGKAVSPYLWKPEVGKYVLSLVNTEKDKNENSRTDSVEFQVR